MKIAMIMRRLDLKGGSQRLFLYIANQYRRLGHDVKIYAFFYSKERCFPDLLEGFEVVALDQKFAADPEFKALRRIPILRYVATLLTMRHETRTAKVLARLMTPDADILNPHERVAERTAHFYRKYVKDVPSVWNTNDTHSMRHLVDKLAAVDPGRFRQPWWKIPVYRIRDWYENWRYISSQDEIVVVDKFNQRATYDYFGRHAFVDRNGPILSQFTYKPRGAPSKRVQLLTSGIFFPHRRFEDAICAVAMLAKQGYDPTLRIIGNPAGDPKYAERLHKLVDELRVSDRVIFLGKISEEELISRYHEADIFLYPHTMQSDGLAPTEAMACGLPPVVSKGAGIHEIITDRKTGLSVRAMDPEDLARAIRELVDTPALYEKISQQAAEFVRKNFTWERYGERQLAILGHVLHGTPVPSVPERREDEV